MPVIENVPNLRTGRIFINGDARVRDDSYAGRWKSQRRANQENREGFHLPCYENEGQERRRFVTVEEIREETMIVPNSHEERELLQGVSTKTKSLGPLHQPPRVVASRGIATIKNLNLSLLRQCVRLQFVTFHRASSKIFRYRFVLLSLLSQIISLPLPVSSFDTKR